MLVFSEGNLYRVDVESIRKKMFEPMSLVIDPPPIGRPQFFTRADFAPKVLIPSAILCSVWDAPSRVFFYLFPLGKRVYVGATYPSKNKRRRLQRAIARNIAGDAEP